MAADGLLGRAGRGSAGEIALGPAGEEGGLETLDGLGEVAAVGGGLGAKAGGEGVEVDHRDGGLAHYVVGDGVVAVDIGRPAPDAFGGHVVLGLVHGGGANPSQGDAAIAEELEDGLEVGAVFGRGDLGLAGVGLALDVVEAAVEQEQVRVEGAAAEHVLEILPAVTRVAAVGALGAVEVL